MNMIYRKKNVLYENNETDTIPKQEMNNMGDNFSENGEKIQQIKALIDRSADLYHYRTFADLDFIIESIGKKDYPGSPALDVLPSHEEIERERRERIKEYIFCLITWAGGTSLEDAVGEFKANEKLLRNIYIHLGEVEEEKKILVQFLVSILRDRVSSPEDVVTEIPDEEFIYHVYKAVLGREPDEDDLKLRMAELRRGKIRQEIVKEIMESKENSRRVMSEIAASVKTAVASN